MSEQSKFPNRIHGWESADLFVRVPRLSILTAFLPFSMCMPRVLFHFTALPPEAPPGR
jgi:hypothetical protein